MPFLVQHWYIRPFRTNQQKSNRLKYTCFEKPKIKVLRNKIGCEWGSVSAILALIKRSVDLFQAPWICRSVDSGEERTWQAGFARKNWMSKRLLQHFRPSSIRFCVARCILGSIILSRTRIQKQGFVNKEWPTSKNNRESYRLHHLLASKAIYQGNAMLNFSSGRELTLNVETSSQRFRYFQLRWIYILEWGGQRSTRN